MKHSLPDIIILAGGFGTRLQGVIEDIPKPMAPVAGRPFLDHVLNALIEQGANRVILSVGHLHEVIMDHYESGYKNLQIEYAVEEEALGTGGGIALALEQVDTEEAIVLNGDTSFDVDLMDLYQVHKDNRSNLTIAARSMDDTDRYGRIEIENSLITSFSEKASGERGYINGGVYVINRQWLSSLALPKKFSFEKQVLESYVRSEKFSAFEVSQEKLFIDIGIPEDYAKAQEIFFLKAIDPSWTLFLDRDGVINKLKDGGYIENWSQFEFIDGVKEAIAELTSYFSRTVVVTNQQGIAKKLMTTEDLEDIHKNMTIELEKAGAKINKIYYCPEPKEKNPLCRKPNPGMALQAQEDFPEIDFHKSVMVGDFRTDMIFGNNLGMTTVYVGYYDRTKKSDLEYKNVILFKEALFTLILPDIKGA